MPWYPDAVRKPVARYQPGGSVATTMTQARRLIFHTAVSSSESLYPQFAAGGPTSHFYIREDGTVEQYVNTDIRSSANLDGNHDCITVESWDNAWRDGNRTEWTDTQRIACARLIVWANEVHEIPMRQLESSRPGTRGVGWHRQGIDGNFPGGVLAGRVSGGETWSSSAGKACPGDAKILALVNDIIPNARSIASGDDDMQLSDKISKDGPSIGALFRRLDRYLSNAGKVNQQLTALKVAVDKLPDDTASKAEVKQLLESLDATIQIVVNDEDVTEV